MHNAITWGSLFGVGFILAGVLAVGVGGLSLFAGGMSDAPAAGESASRTGCIIAVAGIALIALGIWCVS
jgi:hypothetical protein